MSSLKDKKCIPCEGMTKPMPPEEVESFMQEVVGWEVSKDTAFIYKEFVFQDFVSAVVFVTDVAHVAEDEGHHPDMNLHDWNKVTITLSTHAIKGLSVNDFILASKIDEVYSRTDE